MENESKVLNKDMEDELNYLKEVLSVGDVNENETVLISLGLLKNLINK